MVSCDQFDNKTHQINELKLQHAVVDMSLLSAADQIKADASLKSCMSTPSMTNTNKLAALERAMFCSHDALLKNVSDYVAPPKKAS